jgi:hypothetical protein
MSRAFDGVDKAAALATCIRDTGHQAGIGSCNRSSIYKGRFRVTGFVKRQLCIIHKRIIADISR